jgi:hypothetical protein
MVIDRIRSVIKPGMSIPKPAARGIFRIKGDGMRRDEDAIIYTIPNHRDPTKPYQKGVTASEFERAYDQLSARGEFTHEWFRKNLNACAAEGSCNFTTIGGLFKLLGEAEYVEKGVYKKK